MDASQLFDKMTAQYGPTDAENWAAFSVGGKIERGIGPSAFPGGVYLEPMDRGREWGETEYGEKPPKIVVDETEETEVSATISEVDRRRLVNYRAKCLVDSGYDFTDEDSVGSVGFNGLTAIEQIAKL